MDRDDDADILRFPTNPFHPDRPVPLDRVLYGRAGALDYIPNRLRPQSCRLIVVEGPRRIGKTSFLRHLEQRLDAPFLPVYFDLDGRSGQPLPLLLSDLVADVMTVAGVESPTRRRLEGIGRAHNLLVKALNESAGDHRLVILFDEFDVFDHSLSGDAAGVALFPFLQELVMLAENPSFVVATGRMRDEVVNGGSLPLFQTAPVQRLRVLSDEDARRLVTDPLAGLSEVASLAINKIFHLSGGQPFLLQLISSQLFAGPGSGPRTSIGLRDVDGVVSTVLEKAHEGLQWMWDGLAPDEQATLTAVAGLCEQDASIELDILRRETGPDLSEGEVSDPDHAIESLSRLEMLRVAASKRVAVQASLLHRWTAENHPWMPSHTSHESQDVGLPPEVENADPPEPGALPPDLFSSDPLEELWTAAESLQELERPADGPSSPGEPEPSAEAHHDGYTRSPGESDELARHDQARPRARPAPRLDRLISAGLDAFIRGDYDISIATFRHALAVHPGHIGATLGLSRALIGAGQFEAALKALRPLEDNVPDEARPAMGEVYLRWLDFLEGDEDKWMQLLEDAVRAFPDNEELSRRRRGARLLRVKRLLSENRSIEAAAAMGTLGKEHEGVLSELHSQFLDKLEEMTRQGATDAGALSVLLRQLLPDASQAWTRHLGPLLDEAERLERYNPEQSEEMFRWVENTVTSAGAGAETLPDSLRDRLEAGLKRLDARQLQAFEKRFDALDDPSEADQAEAWLEESLLRRRSPRLEERLRALRLHRQRREHFNTALSYLQQHRYEEAQLLAASIVSEAPGFTGRNGMSAVQLLEEATSRKLGIAQTRTIPASSWRTPTATFCIGAGVTALALAILPGVRWEEPGGPSSSMVAEREVSGPAGRTESADEDQRSSGGPGDGDETDSSSHESDQTRSPAPVPPEEGVVTLESISGEEEKSQQDRQPTAVGDGTTSAARAVPRSEGSAVSAPPAPLRRSTDTYAPGSAAPRATPPPDSSRISTRVASRPPVGGRPSTPARAATIGSTDGASDMRPYSEVMGLDTSNPYDAGNPYAAPLRDGTEARDPMAAQVYAGQGAMYAQQGRIEKAVRAYEKATTLDSECLICWLELGKLYERTGQLSKARAALEEVTIRDAGGTLGQRARADLSNLQ